MTYLEHMQLYSGQVEVHFQITAIFRNGKKQLGLGLDGMMLCSLVSQGISELLNDNTLKTRGHCGYADKKISSGGLGRGLVDAKAPK
jgi:hypothetical protein